MYFTLGDLIVDIAQNAAEARASLVEIDISEKGKGDSGNAEFRFAIKDNGKGMDPDELKRAQDPFVTDGVKHPQRKIGLGLPFLIQTAEQSGGGWDIKSEKGKGTQVCAWFNMDNIDTPPAGDIAGTFRTIFHYEGPEEIHIRRSREDKDSGIGYELRKTELIEALGGLDDTYSLILLDQYLRSMEEVDDNYQEV